MAEGASKQQAKRGTDLSERLGKESLEGGADARSGSLYGALQWDLLSVEAEEEGRRWCGRSSRLREAIAVVMSVSYRFRLGLGLGLGLIFGRRRSSTTVNRPRRCSRAGIWSWLRGGRGGRTGLAARSKAVHRETGKKT